MSIFRLLRWGLYNAATNPFNLWNWTEGVTTPTSTRTLVADHNSVAASALQIQPTQADAGYSFSLNPDDTVFGNSITVGFMGKLNSAHSAANATQWWRFLSISSGIGLT